MLRNEKVGLNIQSINCLKVIYISINQARSDHFLAFLDFLAAFLGAVFFTIFFGAAFFGAAFLATFFGAFLTGAVETKIERLGHQRLKFFQMCAQ